MNQKVFFDKNNQQLIIEYRKSAVFFLGIADLSKQVPNPSHHEYISENELLKRFEFSPTVFLDLIAFLKEISSFCWKDFKPIEADSMYSDYDDYYDREFDNNGSLSIKNNGFVISGPYAQLKSNGEKFKFIKFNKRTFSSFIHDLEKMEALV